MTGRDARDATPLGPLPEPHEDPVAAALSETLAADAENVQPGDRLAGLQQRTRRRSARWPLSAGAVAAVAVAVAFATGALGGGRPDGADVRPGASSVQPPPSTGNGGTTTATTSPTSVGAGVSTVLPVYYLGPDGDRLALFREFHRRSVRDTPTAALQLALDEATMNQAVADPELSSPWLPRTDPLTVSRDGEVVTIDVPAAEAQSAGRTAQQARLAVQQLVWTATAVTQDARLGVRVLINGAPGRLFGAEPVGGVVHRASPSYGVLGSVWIEQPSEGQSVGSPVTIAGSACTFEATVAWQLLQGTAVVRSGHTTASSGCPVRGTWRVALGALPAGSYTFRAFEPPASGQGPDRQDTRTFVVR